MSSKRTMTVSIVGDSRSVEKMFGRVGNAGKDMKGRLGRSFSATLSGFKTMAKGLAVAGTALLGGGLFGAFNLANASADLGEAQSKANQVLGDGAAAVFDFGKTAADAFGMSETAAISAASSFGTLLKPSVESSDQLAEMSTNLVGLSGDLASFHNLASEDVAGKIFAGLSGEAEPLKALGVFITAAAVEAKALELGLGDANGEVSEAAKVQARYALILEQTTDAHGDFARTVDGMPNAQRRLAATWDNVKAQLGEKLAPAFADVMTRFANVLPGLLDSALPVFEKVAGFVGGVISELGGTVVAFVNSLRFADGEVTSSGLPGFAERLGGVITQKLVPAFKSVVGWLRDNWGTISDVVSGVFDVVGAAVGFVVDEVLPRVVAAGKAVVGWVREHWPAISETIGNVLERVSSIVRGFVDMVTAFWDRFGDTIVTTIENAFGVLRTIVETGLELIDGVISTFTALLEGDWGAVWEGVKGIVSTALSGLWGIVTGGLGLVWDLFAGFFGDITGGASGAVGDVVSWFIGLPGRIIGALWNAGTALWSIGTDLVNGVLGGIQAAWGGLTSWLWDAVNTLTFGVAGALAGALSGGSGKVGAPLDKGGSAGGYTGVGGYDVAGSSFGGRSADGTSTSARRARPTSTTGHVFASRERDVTRSLLSGAAGGYGFGGIAPGVGSSGGFR